MWLKLFHGPKVKTQLGAVNISWAPTTAFRSGATAFGSNRPLERDLVGKAVPIVVKRQGMRQPMSMRLLPRQQSWKVEYSLRKGN